jgi:hypothetical protein
MIQTTQTTITIPLHLLAFCEKVPKLLDTRPRKHARTMAVSWWERLTVAPNDVNFHLEHHLLIC